MRTKAPCAVCMHQKPPVISMQNGQVADSGLVIVRCPEGHESAVIYQERKHMLLLRSAGFAFLDGHSRESVSSIAAALERCYEFFLRVVCRKRGLKSDVLAETWKIVAKQSERQFGAFCFLYALEMGKPFVLPRRIPEFRNSVIHRGYIPRDEEVIEYGDQVFQVIQEISQVQEETLGKDIVAAQEEEAFNVQLAEVPNGMIWIKLRTTLVKINENNEVIGFPESFAELLAGLAKGKQ